MTTQDIVAECRKLDNHKSKIVDWANRVGLENLPDYWLARHNGWPKYGAMGFAYATRPQSKRGGRPKGTTKNVVRKQHCTRNDMPIPGGKQRVFDTATGKNKSIDMRPVACECAACLARIAALTLKYANITDESESENEMVA